MSNSTTPSHIEITPGVCGCKAHIRGHRIRVQDVVVWHETLGLSVDEIVARYPQLTLAEVHAALSYYFDHVEQIRDAIDESVDPDVARGLRARGVGASTAQEADLLKSPDPDHLAFALSEG